MKQTVVRCHKQSTKFPVVVLKKMQKCCDYHLLVNINFYQQKKLWNREKRDQGTIKIDSGNYFVETDKT